MIGDILYYVDVVGHSAAFHPAVWAFVMLVYVGVKQRDELFRLVDPVYRDSKIRDRKWAEEDRKAAEAQAARREARARKQFRETTKRMRVHDQNGMAMLKKIKDAERERRLREDEERESQLTRVGDTPTARGVAGG